MKEVIFFFSRRLSSDSLTLLSLQRKVKRVSVSWEIEPEEFAILTLDEKFLLVGLFK